MDSSNCKECLIISRSIEGAAHSPHCSTHRSGAPWQCNQLWYTHKSLLLQDCYASSYEAEHYVNQLAQGNESQTKMPSKRKQFTLSDVLPHSRPSTAHLPTPPPSHPQQGAGTSFHSPTPRNEANSAKQKPCEIMSMASLSCSFTCRHYRQLFPRSRQTETAQQIVTDRVRERWRERTRQREFPLIVQ